jgi:antitoxin ChpS
MPAFKIDAKTERAIHSFISRIAKHYMLKGVILFGSRARDTHRPDSDTDLAILLQGTKGKFVTMKLSMDDIAYEVLLDTGVRIQPLPIWEDEWAHPEKYSNPRLLENISREGIRL